MMCAFRYFGLAFALFGASWASAATYTNAINAGGWRAVISVFECRLEQRVPLFGEVVFRTRAGEASGVYLRARTARFQAGEAELVARTPVWLPEQQPLSLGSVPVKRGTRPLWLGSEHAERILSQLSAGMQVELIKDNWYDVADDPDRLTMNSIGFRAEYRKYLHCLAGLLPRNFDQMKRTALYFPAGETDELGSRMTRKLDQMLELVKHDKNIRQFYIDGHTDALGDRAENLVLSQQRAELVKQYLLRRGVPDDWIVLRWHGERYPVASNDSAGGRSKNRRVTVRIERIKQVDVLPLAAK